MPFYQYKVSDKHGQVLQGTLQAANYDAAKSALVTAGYTVGEVREQPTSPTPIAPVPRPSPVMYQNRPGSNFNATTPKVEIGHYPKLKATSAPSAVTEQVKTKNGRDRDLFFLFSQLGSYFRSGMNPAQSLTDLAARTPERYRESLLHVAQVVSEGGRMSDAFERYPYLYPPDVAGTIRAGETAGFLPEAMDEIADKMEASHRLKKRLFYFQIMFLVAFAVSPIIYGVIEGSLESIKLQDAAGGSLPIGSTFGKAVGKSFVHELPLSLALAAGLWAFIAWFQSMKMRDFRHALVARLPVLGPRARAESMARFTWAMTLISRGGLSPQNTFLLGLQSVPNLAIKKRLEQEGEQMGESDKLSTAMRRAAVLPPEFGDIIQTGEITGDVPRALESVHRATDADYRAKNETAPYRSGLILYVLLGVVILFLSAWLLVKYYGGLIHTILGE